MASTAPDATDFMSCLKSQPIDFFVGESNERFQVHRGFIARLSASLNTLVNGPFRERYENSVVWTDVSVETFLRFAQFAYGGNYSDANSSLQVNGDRMDSRGRRPPVQDSERLKTSPIRHEHERRFSEAEENTIITDNDDEAEYRTQPSPGIDARDFEMELISPLPCSAWDFCDRWVRGQRDCLWTHVPLGLTSKRPWFPLNRGLSIDQYPTASAS